MAKSTRSKVKRHFRAKKREQGVYAATEAARLHRLNMKLKVLITTEKDEETPEGDAGAEGESGEWVDDGAADGQAPSDENANGADAMDLDPAPGPSTEKKISTHGPRNSRREQWRASKGLPARPKSKGTNRQGGIAARRKAGRPSRRR
ncbi:hypothetical protein BD310DRAFT_926526 [Dichomitus squalens]|uniref:DUF2423 domain-containing protein n=1 Tax=Dichomitus squalens TaxID=114155 RepID=A0A4Q9PWM3_9APHY|nr:hypothetical protein BD310DRAFT_926526 [Dichomitus squalens]